MNYLTHYIYLLPLLLFTACLTACSEQLVVNDLVPTREEGYFTLSFGVELPDANVLTRADADALDPTKATIKLLAFDENHLLTNVYEGTYTSNKVDDNGTQHNYYTVQLLRSDAPHAFHILVNHNGLDINDVTYGTESDIFTSDLMNVKEGTFVYWTRIEVDKVDEETMTSAFAHLQLVRNYCRVDMEYTTSSKASDYSLVDTEWGMMDIPTIGSVAPYQDGQEFVNFINKDGSVADYNTLSNDLNYHGNIPRRPDNGATFYRLSTEEEAVNIKWQSTDVPIFAFENEGSSGSSLWKKTSFFLRGHLKKNDQTASDYTYYRLSLVDPDENYAPLNMLRNIRYIISIKYIESEGYSTAVEAYTRASGNNVSGSSVTATIPGIVAGNGALQVEYMKKYILSVDTFTMSYRFINDISTLSTNNDDVKLYMLNDSYETTELTTYTADNYPVYLTGLTNYPIQAIKRYTSDEKNYHRNFTFTPNTPEKGERARQATIRVAVTASGFTYLYRDVTFILRERYRMQNMKLMQETSASGALLDNKFVLTVEVPASMPEELFPLDFTFETSPSCVYPNVEKSNMEIGDVHPSIFDASSKTSFHYHRPVKWDVFSTVLTGSHDATGFVESNGYKQVSFFFQLNKTAFDTSETNPTLTVLMGVFCDALSTDPDADIAATTPKHIEGSYTFQLNSGTGEISLVSE
jgi:hypothetical protein